MATASSDHKLRPYKEKIKCINMGEISLGDNPCEKELRVLVNHQLDIKQAV